MDRVDLKHLEADVYIIRIERSLIKIDKQLLRHIPVLASALEDGRLQLGRPYDLHIHCNPRSLRDVLHLLRRQSCDVNPFEDVQSNATDDGSEVLLLVQQLHVAEVLGLQGLKNAIVGKINDLCSREDEFHAAPRSTVLRRFVSATTPSKERVVAQGHSFGSEVERDPTKRSCLDIKQSLSNQGFPVTHDGMAKLSSVIDVADDRMRESLSKEWSMPPLTEHDNSHKRKPPSSPDWSDTPDRAYKKAKTSTENSCSRYEVLVQSSPPLPNAHEALVFGTSLRLSQTSSSLETLGEQDRFKTHEEEVDDLETDNEESDIDEDDFEPDEDDLGFDEQDSFQLDEDEITSDDIDELVMSDPVKYECIASPQQGPQRKRFHAPVTSFKKPVIRSIAPSLLCKGLPSPTSTGLERLEMIQGPHNTKERALKMLSAASAGGTNIRPAMKLEALIEADVDRIPSGTINHSALRINLKQCICEGLSTDHPEPFVMMDQDVLEICSTGINSLKVAFCSIDCSKIRLCQVVKRNEDLWAVQLNCDSNVLPSNASYLVFKSHLESLNFASKLEKFVPFVKVLMVSPAWMKKAMEISLARKTTQNPGRGADITRLH